MRCGKTLYSNLGAAQGAEVEIDTEVVDHPGVDPETGQVVGKGVAVEVDTRYIYISSYSNQGMIFFYFRSDSMTLCKL